MCIEIHETSRVRPTAKTLSPAYRLTRIQSGSQFLRALGSEPCSRDLGGARGHLPEREVRKTLQLPVTSC